MIAGPRLSLPWMLPLAYVSPVCLRELCWQVQRISGEAWAELSAVLRKGCWASLPRPGCSELARTRSLPQGLQHTPTP